MNTRIIECPYAPPRALVCEKKMCATCGWNPEVASARLDSIKQKLFEEGWDGKRTTKG